MGHEQKDFKQASKGSAGLVASRHDEVPRRLSGNEGAHRRLLLHLVVSHERKKSKLASKATAGHEPSGPELHGAHNRDTICRAPKFWAWAVGAQGIQPAFVFALCPGHNPKKRKLSRHYSARHKRSGPKSGGHTLPHT